MERASLGYRVGVSGRGAWAAIEAEAQGALAGEGRFPLPAYSEFMPSPYVVIKPYAPTRAARAATVAASDGDALDVTEDEQVHQLTPGLSKIAGHLVGELDRLVRGTPHGLSRTLLANNPAWPGALAAAAGARRASGEPLCIAVPLALSRTQDDKGNVRWTLFGVSHDGPSAAFWRSFSDGDGDRFAAFVAWAGGGESSTAGLRVLADSSTGEAPELPAFARALRLGDDEPLAGVHTIVSFRPFERLPPAVQGAYLAGRVKVVPHPAGMIFFEHPGYHQLARTLPRATQIPLLHLFSHLADGNPIRIPQSGWLDERADARAPAHGHKVVSKIVRTHRWQRMARDQNVREVETFEDQVSVALFSTDPDDLELYGKPMARNAQIWSEDYALILDGPRATQIEIERAAATVDRGGRFGYRFIYPPMRAGTREIFWHLPLVARLGAAAITAELWTGAPLSGYAQAEAPPDPAAKFAIAAIALRPNLLQRPGYLEAATLFDRDPGRARFTTANNLRKLLAFREQLGERLTPSFARALTHAAKAESLDAWLAALPAMAADASGAARCTAALAPVIETGTGTAPADAETPPADLTFAETSTRPFEERLWKTIAGLAEGEFRAKETADAVLVNKGKTGGPAAKAAHLELSHRRDLDRLGDHLHDRYRALVGAHQMTGRAQVVDHAFRWETDFPFRWSEAWNRNQSREAHERNIVLMIPGRDRGEAVIMADHYDTAYMEDVYDGDRGGDGLRAAAAGADDNHSATAALLAAAEVLLPRARAGTLARDVWLVHLTGEEFPSDCLGARALGRALVERRLRFASETGTIVDVSGVQVVGAFVLDMIAHNTDRDRDVFQIAPGEGAASAKLALRAHRAAERWNRQVPIWNQTPERRGKRRAERQDQGAKMPPPFAHLPLRGEVRPEWDPRSSLYNTDGQIFSDLGIPVVLFMENYDISRTGYHDTQDTMKNIDLDYAAALTAIAIETVAATASEP
jgi:Peptidase family M28